MSSHNSEPIEKFVQLNENISFKDVPAWAIPTIISVTYEVHNKASGKILSIDALDTKCVQVISEVEDDKFRIDQLSRGGSSTLYTNREGINLYMLSRSGLMLEAIFGPASPSSPSLTGESGKTKEPPAKQFFFNEGSDNMSTHISSPMIC